MQFRETPLAGAWVIDPTPHNDDRGRFMRAWCEREFAEHGVYFAPVQANMGLSARRGTIRGMHYQEAPALEAKLMRCTRGAIFDVLIDLRPESASFRKWFGVELSADDGRMLYVPDRCAHGYQTLEECAEIYYLTSEYSLQGRFVECGSTTRRSTFAGRWSRPWCRSRIGTGR